MSVIRKKYLQLLFQCVFLMSLVMFFLNCIFLFCCVCVCVFHSGQALPLSCPLSIQRPWMKQTVSSCSSQQSTPMAPFWLFLPEW